MARFEINFLVDRSDEAVLEELRRIAAFVPAGKHLTLSAYDSLSPRISSSAIRNRFGGWREALEKAGLTFRYGGPLTISEKMRIQTSKGLSDEDLISELKRVHILTGKEWLTGKIFDTYSLASRGLITKRFGSFRKGLELAGISHAPHKKRKYTDEQCFENLANVWTHYGRKPDYRKMFALPSTIQAKTYVLRWGTWRKALAEFAAWANLDQTEKPELQAVSMPETQSPPLRLQMQSEADSREIRPGLRFRVFLKDRFRCVYCGRSPATDLTVELHADHIVAIANGGKTTLENLRTACQSCNLGKGSMAI